MARPPLPTGPRRRGRVGRTGPRPPGPLPSTPPYPDPALDHHPSLSCYLGPPLAMISCHVLSVRQPASRLADPFMESYAMPSERDPTTTEPQGAQVLIVLGAGLSSSQRISDAQIRVFLVRSAELAPG